MIFNGNDWDRTEAALFLLGLFIGSFFGVLLGHLVLGSP